MPKIIPDASAGNRAPVAGNDSTAVVAPAASSAKSPPTAAVVTPTKTKKTTTAASRGKSAAKTQAVSLTDINFQSRVDVTAALKSLKGSKVSVPSTHKTIIRHILTAYSSDELKTFWTRFFGEDAKWPNKQKAISQFVTALAVAGVNETSDERKSPPISAV